MAKSFSGWYFNGKLATFDSVVQHCSWAAKNYEFFDYSKQEFLDNFCCGQEDRLEDFQEMMADECDAGESFVMFIEALCARGAIRLRGNGYECYITVSKLDNKTKDNLIEMLENNRHFFSQYNCLELYDINTGIFWDCDDDNEDGLHISADSIEDLEDQIEG